VHARHGTVCGTPDIELCWLPFANDFYACHSNIKRRASRSTNDNLLALDYCHVQYHIPTGAEVIAGLAT
jgi:hypothetical protein